MKTPQAPGQSRELPELALALALLAALLALGAATLKPTANRAPPGTLPCGEADAPRDYSWPAAPIALVSLLDSA